MTGGRQPAIILGSGTLLLLLLIVLLLPAPNTTDITSHGSGPDGLLALYDWTSQLGFPEERLTNSYHLGNVSTLISVDNVDPMSGDDAEETATFVHGGGTLILGMGLTNLQNDAALLVLLGATTGISTQQAELDTTARIVNILTPVHLADGGHVPVTEPFEVNVNGATTILDSRDGPVGQRFQFGSGTVYLIGADDPFENAGLRQGDSADLVLSMLGSHGSGIVAFDDYHLGAATAAALDPTNPFAQLSWTSPLGLALLACVLTIMVALATGGRRLGKPVHTDADVVPSVDSYVRSMAQLFQRSARRGGVAHRYAEDLKRRLGRASGADPRLPDEAFLEQLERFDPSLGETTTEVLSRARRLASGTPSDTDLVALARDVHALESRTSLAQWRP